MLLHFPILNSLSRVFHVCIMQDIYNYFTNDDYISNDNDNANVIPSFIRSTTSTTLTSQVLRNTIFHETNLP